MKLICELQETIEYELIDEGEGKPKQYFIEGIFMQSEKKNKNGTDMSKSMLNLNVHSEN